ncbi:MAG: endonuclease [Candidatus Marinimicrobia bacterium]|nr:endonuclease [Candidatus Neomarinimicrobiota bacterium]
MKRFWRLLSVFAVLIGRIFAQTTLSSGDIAFTGINSDNPDQISIVFLVDISTGTEIKFTDNGWLATGNWRSGEGVYTWTAVQSYTAGTELILNPSGINFAFSTSGDQVIAYQGTSSMIAAIDIDGSTGWQGDATSSNTSAVPTGLVDGTTCVGLAETDNASYNRTISSGTKAELLAAINNPTNWTLSNSILTLSNAGFTVSGSTPANTLPSITNISHLPATVLSSSTVSVSADVTDTDGTITTVELHWGTTSGSLGTTISMSNGGSGDTYTTTSDIPAQAEGVTVYYEIAATDDDSETKTTAEQQYDVSAAIKAEPSNHILSFTATANGSSTIDLSWTENDGTVIPDGYLIKASTADNVSAPGDGSAVSDNSTIGDDSGAINIAHGTTTYSWTGLNASTPYYFEIYPYTNTGSNIDYKTDGTIPEGNATTEASSGYYSGIPAGASGDALKAALHNLIKGHTEYTYDQAWDILKESDKDPSNPNNVIQIYTGNSVANTGYPIWNREHVWAKSHGGFGETPPAGSDTHHLRPSDPSVNSTRSNLDFDNGGNPVSGTSDCYVDDDSFEPRDEVKGDVARMMFYMVVRYEGEEGYDLELVDNVSTSGPLFGKLSTLIQWHSSDAPDDFEKNRNEVVYGYQGNRNPFIDHPEWVASIWGGGTGPSISAISYLPENPVSSAGVTLSATITDHENTISGVTLKYGTDAYNLTSSVTMTNTSGDIYSGTIPAQSHGSIIYYAVEATNDIPVTSVTETDHYLVFDPQTATLPYAQEFTTGFGDVYRYDAAGDREWEIYSGGYSGNCARFTEFSGYAYANEDWLITPGFDLTSTTNEYLSFITAKNYDPLPLLVKYSTNYAGIGNPAGATWTDIPATLSATNNGDVWMSSGDIDVSSLTGTNIHFAFVYQSTTTTNGYWKLDNISLRVLDPAAIAPTISNITHTPAVPMDTDPVVISATITDNGTIANAQLNWGLISGSLTNSVPLTNAASLYSGTIPAQAQGAIVYYTITATDHESNTTTSPEYFYNVFQPTTAAIPYSQVFSSDLGDWTPYSVTGAQTWVFEPSYGNPAGCAKMTGYSNGSFIENEDWLISPAFNLDNQTGEELSFDNAYNYAGNPLECYYSTDYIGVGDPNLNGTWTQLTGITWSVGNFDYISSGTIDISGISGDFVFFAFKYTSNTTECTTWEVDNITLTGTSTPPPPPAINAWINEFHYDNAGTDAGEAIEVVIENPGSYSLADFLITLYNGNGGASYDSETLDHFAAGSTTGNFTYYSANFPGLQNGGPDGIALSYNGTLIQFLSYEGSFTASGGVAGGQTSTDIGVSETGSSPAGLSLQLIGAGTQYSDFSWSGPMAQTFGSANAGGDQSLPVELSQFTATWEKATVLLKWRTESEINNLGFNIYRSANDEENYRKLNITLIEGAGNSSEAYDYAYTDSDIIPGNRYAYKIEDVSSNGQTEMHGPVTVQTEKTDDQMANAYRLGHAYPNPFNPETTLTYQLPEGCTVKISIYDIQGNLVKSLVNTSQAPGAYKATWNGTDDNQMSVGNGIYIYRMTTSTGYAKTAKVIFLK